MEIHLKQETLIKLDFIARLKGISRPKLISDMLESQLQWYPFIFENSTDYVIELACTTFGISGSDLRKGISKHDIARVRTMLCAILRKRGVEVSQICVSLGLNSHTTVYQNINKIKGLKTQSIRDQYSKDFIRDYDNLLTIIKEHDKKGQKYGSGSSKEGAV